MKQKKNSKTGNQNNEIEMDKLNKKTIHEPSSSWYFWTVWNVIPELLFKHKWNAKISYRFQNYKVYIAELQVTSGSPTNIILPGTVPEYSGTVTAFLRVHLNANLTADHPFQTYKTSYKTTKYCNQPNKPCNWYNIKCITFQIIKPSPNYNFLLLKQTLQDLSTGYSQRDGRCLHSRVETSPTCPTPNQISTTTTTLPLQPRPSNRSYSSSSNANLHSWACKPSCQP